MAAAADTILTDDPYGLAKAFESLGGYLYVPTVGLGRLVETPDQILAALDRFAGSDGVLEPSGQLAADSTVSAGYGAWSELPQQVTEALAWRSGQNQQLEGTWTADDMESAIFGGDDDSPRVVSINTHADETRMLPGVPGAESGEFADTDLFLAEGHEDAPSLDGALVFLIGCHAGNNLPTAYYGDRTDWVDVFSQAGGFVGNTGYGLANDTTTALSERLLSLYAKWIGVDTGSGPVTAAQALTYAKQSYLADLGLYSGYDEKVLMESVYYGLPMYTFTAPATPAPLPEIPAGLSAVETRNDGLSSASLSLRPSFTTTTVPGPDGTPVEVVTADGQDPAVVAGQPVLPKVVSRLDAPPPGLVPRGALITSLSSQSAPISPAFGTPTVGVETSDPHRSQVAFPSVFATITNQDTPDGPADLLVVTPARIEAPAAGAATIETFTEMGIEVMYGDAASGDTTAPVVTSIERPCNSDGPAPRCGSRFLISADGTGSAVTRVVLLIQPEGESAWRSIPVAQGASGRWEASIDVPTYRWILQLVDAAGNVAIETDRGRLGVVGAAAPELGELGDAVDLVAGSRLQRSVEITDAAPGDDLTARLEVSLAEEEAAPVARAAVGDEEEPRRGPVVASAVVPVQFAADGSARAVVDQLFDTPGDYVTKLAVCRGDECTNASLEVTVDAANTAPVATVSLSGNANPIDTETVLTASATATDADGDAVQVQYVWTRDGIVLPGANAETLNLSGLAEEGDVIAVTAQPFDGTVVGNTATAEVLVHKAVIPPALPTIVATATTAGGAYIEGEWSTDAVTVTFACTAPVVLVLPCPAAQTIDDDTTSSGELVEGSITDLLGRTATASVLVRVDVTAPTLAPVVTPSPVTVGQPATATPNATDASSGVASQSCDVPATATAGAASVECRAADVAGNTTTVRAYYTVAPAGGPDPTPSPTPTPTPTPAPTPAPPSASPAPPPSASPAPPAPTTPSARGPRIGNRGGSSGGSNGGSSGSSGASGSLSFPPASACPTDRHSGPSPRTARASTRAAPRCPSSSARSTMTETRSARRAS